MSDQGVSLALAEQGWALLPESVPAPLVDRLRADLAAAGRACRDVQVRNGLGASTDGTAHHIVGFGGSFLELLDDCPAWPVLDAFFGGRYILNSFGGVLHVSGQRTYIGRVHRDVRTFTGGLRLMANVLVMLDPFTPKNGATYLLPGSHRSPDKPTDEAFYSAAVRAVGPAGSVVVFDSNLWHAAGENQTGDHRRALTLTVTPPYLKQQCDYPRMLGYDRGEQFSPRQRQLLGYNSRIAASLDEWYQPADRRLYRPDQG